MKTVFCKSLKKSARFCLACLFVLATTDLYASDVKTIFSFDLAGADLSEENLNIAEFGQTGQLLTDQNGSLQSSSPYNLSVGAGLASDKVRALLELYRTEADIDNFPNGAFSSTSLYYSMYWTDNIPYVEFDNLKFILGAGVGVAKITLDDSDDEFLSDEVISFKATLGVEYALLDYLALSVKYELSNFGKASESQSIAGGRSRSDYDSFVQNRFSLGVNFFY